MDKPISFEGLRWEKDRDSLVDLLGQPGGRWFIARLLDICGIWPPRVIDWSNEKNAAIEEGMRRIGIRIVRDLKQAGKEEALGELLAEYRETLGWMKETVKGKEGTCRYGEIAF